MRFSAWSDGMKVWYRDTSLVITKERKYKINSINSFRSSTLKLNDTSGTHCHSLLIFSFLSLSLFVTLSIPLSFLSSKSSQPRERERERERRKLLDKQYCCGFEKFMIRDERTKLREKIAKVQRERERKLWKKEKSEERERKEREKMMKFDECGSY